MCALSGTYGPLYNDNYAQQKIINVAIYLLRLILPNGIVVTVNNTLRPCFVTCVRVHVAGLSRRVVLPIQDGRRPLSAVSYRVLFIGVNVISL